MLWKPGIEEAIVVIDVPTDEEIIRATTDKSNYIRKMTEADADKRLREESLGITDYWD